MTKNKNKGQMFDIVTIGSAVQDIFAITNQAKVISTRDRSSLSEFLSFEYGGKLEIENIVFSIGGGGCNTATSFAKLGLKTAFLGMIGQDNTGEIIKKHLKDNHISSSLLKESKQYKSGLSIVLSSFEGERTILVFRGANNYLKKDQIPWSKLKKTKWIYLNSLTAQSGKIIPYLTNLLKKENINLAFNPGSAQLKQGLEKLKPILRQTSILLLNKEEAAKLTQLEPIREVVDRSKCTGCGDCVRVCPVQIFKLDGEKKAVLTNRTKCIRCSQCISVCTPKAIKFEPWIIDVREMLRKLHHIGAQIVIITDGKKGAQIYDGKNHYIFPIYPHTVVDTLGAGDSFGSTFTAGYIKYQSITKAVKLATANAASVVSHYGAQTGLLSLEELEKTINEHTDIEVVKHSLD